MSTRTTTVNPLATAKMWIDGYYALGAEWIGVSCNPNRREIYLVADEARQTIYCSSRQETVTLKGILHDYIGQLPQVNR
jgi:hypothetical protein